MTSLLAIGCVFLLGCGGDQVPAGTGGGASVGDTALVISSDPELRRQAAELLPSLAERAGLELLRPVRVEKRTREELERYLVAKLDEELSEEEAGWVAQSYGLLGLAPPDLDLRALLLSVYTEQVAGFYDPDSTALFVMDDQPAEELGTVLIHELVHAVQDQSVDLAALTDRRVGNDRQTAAHAAIEGHATLVMIEYVLEQSRGRPVKFSELPDMASLMEATLSSMETEYPALAGAPRVLQESLLFPYLRGAAFVQSIWEAEGRGASVLDDYLPASTEQVIDPDRLIGPVLDSPVELGFVDHVEQEIHYSNSLGMLELEVFLRTHLGAEYAALASGWGGDRYALTSGPDGTAGLTLAVAWDDPESRDRFLSAVETGLSASVGDSTVEALELDGIPISILRFGPASEVEVVLESRTRGGIP